MYICVGVSYFLKFLCISWKLVFCCPQVFLSAWQDVTQEPASKTSDDSTGGEEKRQQHKRLFSPITGTTLHLFASLRRVVEFRIPLFPPSLFVTVVLPRHAAPRVASLLLV
jgi:hypothetical protein